MECFRYSESGAGSGTAQINGSGVNCVTSQYTTGQVEEIRWKSEVIQRVVTLTLLMIITLVGNCIIITVLSCGKEYRKLNRRVNIFIINLAIGDICVCLFTMTTEILFVVFNEEWVLGPAACKILLYVQIVTLASTTFILVAMSLDRYTAICNPLSFGATRSRARKMIAVSWIMALLFATPQLFIFKQVSVLGADGVEKLKCRSVGYTADWQRVLYFHFLAGYILVTPGMVISYCYINVVQVVWRQSYTGSKTDTSNGPGVKGCNSDSNGQVTLRKSLQNQRSIPRAKVIRVRTVKMTLSIICSFVICWTPYFLVHIINIWAGTEVIKGSVMVAAETIPLVNSALNPIIYSCFNVKIKSGLVELCCSCRRLGGGGGGAGALQGSPMSQARGGWVKGHTGQQRHQTLLTRRTRSSGSSDASAVGLERVTVLEADRNGSKVRVVKRFTADRDRRKFANGNCRPEYV